MAHTVHLELVTPAARILSEDVEQVVIPGEAGDFGVMANHATLISMIRPGIIHVHHSKDKHSRYFVNGGYASIANNRCTILAESLIPAEQLHKQEAQKELDALYAALKQVDSEHKRAALQRQILETEAKLFVSGS